MGVNDLTNPETLAHLLKYDSVLGNCPAAHRESKTASLSWQIHQGI